jgi:hypothetical protein
MGPGRERGRSDSGEPGSQQRIAHPERTLGALDENPGLRRLLADRKVYSLLVPLQQKVVPGA